MLKSAVISLLAFTVVSGPVWAETQSCEPAKLAAQVDRYASQPFSALNYRVLSGLGDPNVEPAASYDTSWEDRDAYQKLVQSVLPSAQPVDIGYDCRTSYPLAILKGHIAKFGVNDPYVVQWAKVQSQVFSACSSAQGPAVTLIDPLTGTDAIRDEAQRFDRAYQTASIAFYRDKTKAVELFRQIAGTASPHKAAARYNIANLLANGKQVEAARSEAAAILQDPALSSVHTITKQLLGYIANLEDSASGWSSLINSSIATVLQPAATVTASPDAKQDYARALSDLDYAGIRSKDTDWWITGTLPENPTISKAIVDASRQSPLALWVMGGQSLYERQQSLPWVLRGKIWQDYASGFVAKVEAVQPSSAQMPALAKLTFETLKADADSASLATVWEQYKSQAKLTSESCGTAPETAALAVSAEQAIRVASVQGKFADVYNELTKQPLRSTELMASKILPQLMGYLLSTGNVEEGRRLRDHLLTPDFIASLPEGSSEQARNNIASFMAWIAEDQASWQAAVQRSGSPMAAPLYNYLTTAELWKQAEDISKTAEQRALLARAAWTREYALQKSSSASAFSKLIASNPQLKLSADQLARDYPKLTEQQRQLLFVLRNPRLSPMVNVPSLWSTDTMELGADSSYSSVGDGDHNDRNWWCPLELDRHLGNLRSAYDSDVGVPSADAYGQSATLHLVDPSLRKAADQAREKVLAGHPVIKSASWKKLQQLADAPSAPKRLSLAAIAWAAKARPNDQAAAEALALAVKTTRYGCNWHGGHKAYSKKAQELLKAKFNGTSFAASTPYWFDCMDSVWNEKGERATSCRNRDWPAQKIPGNAAK